MVLEESPQNPVNSKNEEQGNSRQSSQPRATRSQNVSIKVAFLWTLHAEGHQFREGPTGRHNQQLKKKRWPEVTLDGLHTDGCGISLAEDVALSEIVTHGDSSFIESPEVGNDLTAREGQFEFSRENFEKWRIKSTPFDLLPR